MDLSDLLAMVRASHARHFHDTPLPERLRDLSEQVARLVHHRDPAHLREKAGDVAWAVLQLCDELGLDPAEAVAATVRRLDDRAVGRKVALIGTSANPITNGHLTMALEVLALTDVDQVWFLLVGEHAWGKPLMPAVDRLAMARLAVARYPRLRVDDFELVHGPRIYPTTRETAEILRDHYLPLHPGVKFSFVIGSDVAQTFHRWRGAEWMAEHLDLIVIHRLGYAFDQASSLLAAPRHRYLKDDIVTSNISSSLVRARGRAHDPDLLVALVPEVVWTYLRDHGLLDPTG